MTENQKYTAAVASGSFPHFRRVPNGSTHMDARGIIENVLLGDFSSAARISSKRGSIRANHLHKTDWHYAYVESGSVYYFERAPGMTEVPDPVHYRPGETFFTPPNVEHAMLFAEDSVIWTFAKNIRTHENHESDLIRVEMVTPAIAAKYVPPLHEVSTR